MNDKPQSIAARALTERIENLEAENRRLRELLDKLEVAIEAGTDERIVMVAANVATAYVKMKLQNSEKGKP